MFPSRSWQLSLKSTVEEALLSLLNWERRYLANKSFVEIVAQDFLQGFKTHSYKTSSSSNKLRELISKPLPRITPALGISFCVGSFVHRIHWYIIHIDDIYMYDVSIFLIVHSTYHTWMLHPGCIKIHVSCNADFFFQNRVFHHKEEFGQRWCQFWDFMTSSCHQLSE